MKGSGDRLSYAVIGKAMQVHNELGPGLDEMLYHECLAARLSQSGIAYQFKPRTELLHRGLVADIFEPDLIVENRLVPELKMLWGSFLPEHFVQVTTYLKHWNIPIGLLLDFGKESLVHRRFIFTDPPFQLIAGAALAEAAPAQLRECPLALHLSESLARIANTYGFGYRDTTYRGLLLADLKADGLALTAEPTVCIHLDAARARETRLRAFTVANQCAILVLSLRDRIRNADRAILQAALRHLRLPWGLVVNFGRRELHLHWQPAVNPQSRAGS